VLDSAMLYAGSALVTVWGVAHLAPTRGVVKGFGGISQDNQRIITMEWLAEGLALCFIGLLALSIAATAGPDAPVARSVYRACAAMLVAMAALTAMTGARTALLPMKLCPLVKTTGAVLLFVGSVL